MATYDEQTDLIYTTVQALNDLREDTYTTAKAALEAMASNVDTLPLTIVDTTIGASVTRTWHNTSITVDAPQEPSWLDAAIAGLPADAPTVPLVELTTTDLTESAPAALTGSVGDPGEISLDTVVVPELGTIPTISVVAPSTPDIALPGSISFSAPIIGSVGEITTVTSTVPAPAASISVPDITVSLPALANLEEVPLIETVIPVISEEALTATFNFSEPVYTGEISSTLEASLLNVLGGNPVLSQSYWNARLASVQADISKEQTGALRRASNAGASSWMPLPSEGRLSAVDAVNDAAAAALQKARIELGIEQTRQAREDFWNAVQQGLAYENMWVSYNDHVAQRSLSAAEQLVRLAIDTHNAKANFYNVVLGLAKLNLEKDQANVSRGLELRKSQLQESELEINEARLGLDAGKIQVDRAIAEQDSVLRTKEQEINVARFELDRTIAQSKNDLDVERLGLDYTKIRADIAQLDLEAQTRSSQQVIESGKLALDLFGKEIALATLDKEIDQANVTAYLDGFRASLTGAQQKLEKLKLDIQKYQARWETTISAFNADTTRGQQQIQRFGEVVKAWGIQVEAQIKEAEFPLRKAEIESKLYADQYGAVNSIATATKAIMDSRVAARNLSLEASKAQTELDKARNDVEVEVGKITQAAQQAKAAIDVSQAEWVSGQANMLVKELASLTSNYAQAVAVASDVSLTSSVGATKHGSVGFSYSGKSNDHDPGSSLQIF